MDIDKLEGRELDKAVALVKGEVYCACPDMPTLVTSGLARVCWRCRNPRAKQVSTRIAAAWELVEEAVYISIEHRSWYEPARGMQWIWDCEFALPEGRLYSADADTAPTAIRRAYLKAKASD